MSDLVDCKYCCFWETVSKNLANIVFFACFRPEMLEHHCKYCYFRATVSKNLVNIIIFARHRPNMLENHCKYCYFWATVSKKLNFLLGFLTFQNPACKKPCKYCCFWPRARPSVKSGMEPAGIRVSTPRFPFPRSQSLENPSTKVVRKINIRIAISGRRCQKYY